MSSVREILSQVFDNPLALQRATNFCYRVKRYFGVDSRKVAEAIVEAHRRCLSSMDAMYRCIGVAEIGDVLILDVIDYTNRCGRCNGVFKYEKLVAIRKSDYEKWKEFPDLVKTVWTVLWCG